MFQYWDSLKSIIPGRVEADADNYQEIMCRGNAKFMKKDGTLFNAHCNAIYYVNR